MGSIQNRRGSAKQAPPSVYAPFIDFNSEVDEQFVEFLLLTTRWVIYILLVGSVFLIYTQIKLSDNEIQKHEARFKE